MKKKLMFIFKVLAGILLVVFAMLIYKKFEQWIGSVIGDNNWTIIIVGILLLIFVVLGFLSVDKVKKKFL
jgi:hypothetical protein